jgi:diacylglycerol kinase family enzyme
MSERLVLLVNPSAGSGRGLADQHAVERILGERGPVTTVIATDERDLEISARDAAAAGHTIVIAGGDGTVNRVVQTLGTSRTPLGVIPAGSGNDFARALGLPRDHVEAARRIARSSGTAIDLVEVNGRPCCTVGGLGLIADVTGDIARLGRPGRVTRPIVRGLGSHAYLLAAVCRLALPNTRAWPVSVEGTGAEGAWRWSGLCHALLVANYPTLGAGLALPIDAAHGDGQAEVCIVPRRSRVSLAVRLAALRTGRPLPERVLTVRRASRASIHVEDEMPFASDGEVVCVDRRLEMVVRPRALTILC